MQVDPDSSTLSTHPDPRWDAIAHASATVTLLAQRDSGLWSYATTAAEARANYSLPGSDEWHAKSGSESLTATYLGLGALAESFGNCPPDILHSALEGLERHRDRVQPVYGTLIGGLRPRINKSARHTAMVLLAKLSGDSPPFDTLEHIALWILDARLPDGGWSYEESNKTRPEPVSTAACLCALSCFLARYPHVANDKRLAHIRPALVDGFDSLVKLRLQSALWLGFNPGQTDVIDSCFVVDLLSIAPARNQLQQFVPRFSVELAKFKHALKKHAVGTGWPDAWGQAIGTSLGATVSALYVLDGFQGKDAAWQSLYRNIQQFLLSQLSEKNGGARLTSWDWIMLCRLAARRFRIREENTQVLLRAVERFQEVRRDGKLEKSLPNISNIARTAIIFLISRGQFTEVPHALIMKGGGVKGLAFAGAIQELEKHYKFDTFVGTSAGSIAAALLAAGATGASLEKELRCKSFLDFLDGRRVPFTHFALGGHPGDELVKWIAEQLAKYRRQSSILKMKDLEPRRTVIYAAARADRGDIPFDSKGERADTAVHTAVRCSISIPYFFKAPEIDNRRVYDGGLLNNYPVEIFLRQQKEKWLLDFVALYLGTRGRSPLRGRWIILDLLAIWLERNDADVLDRFNNDTVIIDTHPVGTIDFGLTGEEKDLLVLVGRAAALEFLQKRGVLDASRAGQVQEACAQAEAARANVVETRRKRRNRRWQFAVIAALAIGTLGWWIVA